MPRTGARWEREVAQQTLEHWKNSLDFLVTRDPSWRYLKDPEEQKRIRSRLPWEQREEYFETLTRITGEKQSWSHQHPFDDLTREEMQEVGGAARLVRSR
jgi:hypothetical protein